MHVILIISAAFSMASCRRSLGEQSFGTSAQQAVVLDSSYNMERFAENSDGAIVDPEDLKERLLVLAPSDTTQKRVDGPVAGADANQDSLIQQEADELGNGTL